jgi:hypothetical protein
MNVSPIKMHVNKISGSLFSLSIKLNTPVIRKIGSNIGRDIDIDMNGQNFFNLKTPPPRHLYPLLYHPKPPVSNNETNIDINIDDNSNISIKMKNVNTVNISVKQTAIPLNENQNKTTHQDDSKND